MTRTPTVEFSPSAEPFEARHFYVSARSDRDRAPRYVLVAGPYATLAAAEAAVPAVRRLGCERDARAVFYGWGTAGSADPITTPFGVI